MIAQNSIFKFTSIEFSDGLSDEICENLLDEKIQGILIKNFLSASEIETVKNSIKHIPTSKKTIINDGFHSYPLSFAQFTQMIEAGLMNVQDYLNIADDLLKNQDTYIGIDLMSRLVSFLEKQSIFKEVSPIIEKSSQKPLIPFNIRELFPGNGELIVHCENLFFEEFPSFFEWLKLMDITDNKLSYFITIQKAEIGGELCCYNLNWKTTKKRISHTQLLNEDGYIIDVENKDLETFLIKPDEGDLLLFSGGNIWHKVLTVQGTKSRITIGGFIAETNKPGSYYIWS